MNHSYSAEKFTFDISNLIPGIYYSRISDSKTGKSFVQKIIKI